VTGELIKNRRKTGRKVDESAANVSLITATKTQPLCSSPVEAASTPATLSSLVHVTL